MHSQGDGRQNRFFQPSPITFSKGQPDLRGPQIEEARTLTPKEPIKTRNLSNQMKMISIVALSDRVNEDSYLTTRI